MKKAFPVIAAVLVLAVAAGILLSIPGTRVKILGVTPRYHFKQGEKWEYKNTVKFKTNFEGAGKKAGFTPSGEINSQTAFQVSRAAGEEATLVFQAKVIGIDIPAAVKKISLDPQKREEARAVLTIDTRGKISQVRPSGALEKKDVENLYFLFCGNPVFPEEALRPGNTWKENIDLTLHPGEIFQIPLKGPITYRMEGLEKLGETECIVITFQDQFKTLASIGDDEKAVKTDALVQIRGKSYFDLKQGLILKSSREITLDLTYPVPFTSSKVSMKSSFDVESSLEK